MRVLLSWIVWVVAVASSCAAQLASFTPCIPGKPSTVGHSDGITIQRLAIIEPTGEIGASVLLPDSGSPLPGIVFSHSEILGPSEKADLHQLAWALARAGAASIILDGTIDWRTPNDDSERAPHTMACAGQWLLLHANLDRRRLAHAGPDRHWGGGDTPFCLPAEVPCWHPGLWLNFGQTSPAESANTERMLTSEGRLFMAQFAQNHLRLREIRPDWLQSASKDYLEEMSRGANPHIVNSALPSRRD